MMTTLAACDTSRKSLRCLEVTVLAGGPGSEREVSLDSGRAVLQAMLRLGHRARMMDIGPDDLSALEWPADFVFVALHGEFGEDGAVQAELEKRGLHYGGSGVHASRNAMDKVAAKRLFQQHGVPTPPYEMVQAHDLSGLSERFAVPAVVKPVASGSSVDTTIERTAEGLQEAAAGLVHRYGAALVEQYIEGPELTVGILGDCALPVCEIRPTGEFYDYHAKYVADDTEYLFDLEYPRTLLSRVKRLSLQAHRALGCEVFSRVDWMLDAETREPFALEVNTIPGFTSHSLLPKAAGREGLSFDDLCQRIIELSLKKK
jgi:D-alanine-D-alanine ligase